MSIKKLANYPIAGKSHRLPPVKAEEALNKAAKAAAYRALRSKPVMMEAIKTPRQKKQPVEGQLNPLNQRSKRVAQGVLQIEGQPHKAQEPEEVWQPFYIYALPEDANECYQSIEAFHQVNLEKGHLLEIFKDGLAARNRYNQEIEMGPFQKGGNRIVDSFDSELNRQLWTLNAQENEGTYKLEYSAENPWDLQLIFENNERKE